MNLRSATLWLAAATALAPGATAKKKGKGPNAIKSTCTTDANGKSSKKCHADTSSFSTDVPDGDVTQFDFGEGNNFACAKKATPHGSEFHGECSPGLDDDASAKAPGTANAITRGGKTYGSLHVDRKVCQWGPDENGDEWVECLDEDEFPPEGDMDHDFEEEEADVPVPGSAEAEALDEFEEASRRDRRLRAGFREAVASPVEFRRSSLRGITEATNKHRRLVDDSGGNLDVLVVWTNKAECRRSGLSAGCTHTDQTETNMRALLDLAIEETNTAYDESGIDTQLRLVHAYRHPDYVEASSNAFNAALNVVTSTTDGVMDDVHDKRDAFGADMVAMIIDDPQYCGLAWLPSNPANSPGSMFSVTAWNCATGYYSFGHEIGHNLGCNHDRRTSNGCSSGSYNYGWRDPGASFRTTLAYNCGGGAATGTCVDEAGGGCSRIQRYSNPNFTFNGKPLGNANNDNARRINDVKAGVAAFRSVVPDCAANSDCEDNDACTTNVCEGICLFEPIDCDDNNACTIDSCSGGNCINDQVDCDDGNACTVDTCDPIAGCNHEFVGNCCGNGVCEANESGTCIADCSEGPFTVAAPKCNTAGYSCYIRDGHMFDVVAKDSRISITTLKLFMYQNGAGVEVWTRPGTYQGSEFSSSGWTKISDTTSTVPGWNLYQIPEASFESVAIEAGARQAFYVVVVTGNQLYFNSGVASTSSIVAQDDHLTLYEGHVMNPDFQGRGGVRVWSGDIVYVRETVQATPPPTPAVPATPQPTSPPTPLPTPDPTPNPTADPTPGPTSPPTPNPTAPLTPEPTGPPTPGPTSPPSPEPTSPPTPLPTADPTPNPTAPLTPNPTAPPTPNPTAPLTPNPTAPPTAETPEPTSPPTPLPTTEPTGPPTPEPSPATPGPTSPPSPEPTGPSTPNATSPPSPEPTSPPTPNPTAPITPNPTEPPVAESTPRPTSPPTPEPTSPPSPEPTSPPSPNPTLPVTPEPTSPPTPLPTADPTPNPTAPPTPALGGEPCTGPVLELYDFESGDYSNQVTGVRRQNGAEYNARRPWTRRAYGPSVCGGFSSLMAGQSNNGKRGGVDDETRFTVYAPDGAGSFDFMYNRNLLDANFDRFQVFVNGAIVHSFHGGNAQFVDGCMLATCVNVDPGDEVQFLCKNRGKEEWCSIDNLRFF